jgi:hypothetical protein
LYCHRYFKSRIDNKHFLKAIELSRNGSTVLTFTDASAKDGNRSEEVIMAAHERNITLTTILTGSCSSRKRRSVSRKFRLLANRCNENFSNLIYQLFITPRYIGNTNKLGFKHQSINEAKKQSKLTRYTPSFSTRTRTC